MPVRVGINGFGRTGRATFRAAHERDTATEWAGINDVMDIEMLAHLLRHAGGIGGAHQRRLDVRVRTEAVASADGRIAAPTHRHR